MSWITLGVYLGVGVAAYWIAYLVLSPGWFNIAASFLWLPALAFAMRVSGAIEDRRAARRRR